MVRQERHEREPLISSALEFPFLPLPAAAVLSPDHPSGISTPPLQTTSASVPFKWEEQPGKPRPCTDIIPLPEPGPAKILGPPPCRMLLPTDPSKRNPKMHSPTTVLDGPNTSGRPKFSSFRFFFRESSDGSSSDSPHSSVDPVSLRNRSGGQGKRGFSVRGLMGFKSGNKDADEGSFGFSLSSSSTDGCDVSADGRFKMEGKMKRNGRSLSLSQPTSPRLCGSSSSSIYERLKHGVPWKSTRKFIKKAEHGSVLEENRI
ncbi:hypothetical protein OROMI_017473 [Orobanche minor]